MTSVAIIDYGMGNLRSVANALRHLEADVVLANSPAGVSGADRLVLPGVGAFSDGISRLREQGWIHVLEHEVFENGTPILGVCLGMQLLIGTGTEHGEHKGLGWIPGRADRLTPGPGVRVPHVGWNDVEPSGDAGLFSGVAHTTFYFVHSYAVVPDDPEVVTSWCTHGETFAASLRSGAVYGVQFHPEKSHRAGLQLLANFLAEPC